MVKTPNERHSKPRRDPVTIDLKAESASSAASSESAASATSQAKPDAAPRPAAAAPNVAQSATAKIEDKPATIFGRDSGKTETPRQPETKLDAAGSKPAESKPFEAKPASSTAPPRAAPEPQRRGGMSALAAGLVGGVVTLAGAGALQWAGVLPAPSATADNSALEAQVAQLKSQVEAIPAPADLGGRIDALTAEVNEAKTQLAAVAAGANPSPEAAQALENRLKTLETGLASAQGGGAGVDLTPVTERIAAVETAAGKSARDVAAAVAAVGERIAVLEKSVGELTGKVAEQAEQPKAALAIAASALKAAIDRGDPFATELDTYAAVAPPAAELDALRAMATAGVASQEAISAAFPDAAAAMIAAGKAQDPNAGFFDKLMSSAQSLVQVRPVGMVEGEGAGETVARMEVHLNKGDYPAAVAEYDKLPEPAKIAGASFIALVKARMAADQAADAILASALKA